MAEKFLCELVSSESVYALAYTLASEIRASGFRPDLVVAISRGGFTPARVLCDALGIFNLTSIRIFHYKRAATKNGAATVKYPLCIPVNGLRLLVVDDVNDSGDTLREARKHLETLGPKELRTAVLQEKAGSTVCADYVAESVAEWRWLIYPWAVVEDVGGFLKEMEPPPSGGSEAAERLRRDYGLVVPTPQLERLLSLIGSSG